jgi:hypothetical protein
LNPLIFSKYRIKKEVRKILYSQHQIILSIVEDPATIRECFIGEDMKGGWSVEGGWERCYSEVVDGVF